jgi:hypothetical protein
MSFWQQLWAVLVSSRGQIVWMLCMHVWLHAQLSAMLGSCTGSLFRIPQTTGSCICSHALHVSVLG